MCRLRAAKEHKPNWSPHGSVITILTQTSLTHTHKHFWVQFFNDRIAVVFILYHCDDSKRSIPYLRALWGNQRHVPFQHCTMDHGQPGHDIGLRLRPVNYGVFQFFYLNLIIKLNPTKIINKKNSEIYHDLTNKIFYILLRSRLRWSNYKIEHKLQLYT